MYKGPSLGETEVVELTKAVIELGDLAMQFGRIDRTCVAHPNGLPESDSDHTVMLTWIAPALAEMVNLRAGYERYPVGKVAQFAAVHDACEVYAGDTPTIRISPEEYADKEAREAEATARLRVQFRQRLPWFARMVRTYEDQTDPAARFVRSVDKILPKIVHVINAAGDLLRVGMSREEFQVLYARQRAQIADWCPEPLLLQLYDELCGEVLRHYSLAATDPHYVIVKLTKAGKFMGARLLHSSRCEDEISSAGCPLALSFLQWLNESAGVTGPGSELREGIFPVRLSSDGMLEFYGKQED